MLQLIASLPFLQWPVPSPPSATASVLVVVKPAPATLSAGLSGSGVLGVLGVVPSVHPNAAATAATARTRPYCIRRFSNSGGYRRAPVATGVSYPRTRLFAVQTNVCRFPRTAENRERATGRC